MTKRELINRLNAWQENKICLEDILTDVEQYSNSQHDGKPIVSGSLPLVEALEQYIGVLVEELDELASMVATHGWKSSRVEIGEQLRNRITELKRQ